MKGIQKYYPNFFTYPAITIYLILFIIPTAMSFYYSFTDWDVSRTELHFVGIHNFLEIFKDEVFNRALFNTIYFAFVSSFFKIAFGLLLALALIQPLKSKIFLRSIYFYPAVVSVMVVGLLFTSILRYDGLLNHLFLSMGLDSWILDWLVDRKFAMPSIMLTEIWKWSGLCMVIFLAGLQSIPMDYYEAAKIDGASAYQRFSHITMPLLIPALSINVTINVIGGLKVFEQVYVLTRGGPAHLTEVLNTLVIQAFGQGFYGKATAMGFVLFIFTTVISLSIHLLLKRKETEL